MSEMFTEVQLSAGSVPQMGQTKMGTGTSFLIGISEPVPIYSEPVPIYHVGFVPRMGQTKMGTGTSFLIGISEPVPIYSEPVPIYHAFDRGRIIVL
jgi:hypothetical protein